MGWRPELRNLHLLVHSRGRRLASLRVKRGPVRVACVNDKDMPPTLSNALKGPLIGWHVAVREPEHQG